MTFVRNLSLNQNATKRVETWSPSGESVTVKQNDDGSWTYTCPSHGSVVVPFNGSNPYYTPGSSYVSVMHCDPVDGVFWRNSFNLSVLKDGTRDGVWHMRTIPVVDTVSPFWHPQFTCANPVTIRRLGLYTESDWQELQQLGLDWFDADLMPLTRS